MFALHSIPALMALLVLPASQALACGASVQVLDTWVEQGNFFPRRPTEFGQPRPSPIPPYDVAPD